MLDVILPSRAWCALACLLCAPSVANPQAPARGSKGGVPLFVEQGTVERAVLRATGEALELPTHTVWRPVCGSDQSVVTAEELARGARLARQQAAAHPAPIHGAVATGPGGLNLVFNVTTALPAEVAAALAAIEQYIELHFSDPVTVVIDFAYSPLGAGVLGQTGTTYTSASWDTIRTALQADMDEDDTIQAHLPPGSTIPVRYNGMTGTVTNENQVFVTIANFRAAVGSIGGPAASMTINSNINWDFTPPNISAGFYCFHSVVAHEVTHTLGFVSGAEFRVEDMEMLDIYRFQRAENGGSDYNPDDLTEFATTARMVDKDEPTGDDNVNSDLITAEYQMSDGVPYQASHLHELTPATFLMEPLLLTQETLYPEYYRGPDLALLDAIGWDNPLKNTACADPISIKCNAFRSLSNTVLGGSPNPPYSCGSGNAHTGSLWFSFVADATSANVSTCGSTAQDSTIAVYGGTCGSLVELACSEDGGCPAGGLSSVCATGLTIGQTYLVQISARTPAHRGDYLLQIDCSCKGGCCLTPPAECVDLKEVECAQVGGTYLGADVLCESDINQDGVDDACEQSYTEFSQIPTAQEEDAASSADLMDFSPADVVADDFTSDGRPIHWIRWWGSVLDAGVQPDGWLIAFHEPLITAQPAAEALGLYFCGSDVLSLDQQPIVSCDPHAVIEYSTRLFDCCLLHAMTDSRSGGTPAQGDAFHAELCRDYDLSIQAAVGSRYDFDSQSGQCVPTPTGESADDDFWGWHTTDYEHGTRAALASGLSMTGSDWLYGPWAPLAPSCAHSNAAFELITTAPPGSDDRLVWDNGAPNDQHAMSSQYGGERSDWITVDDIELASVETIRGLYWIAEEEPAFTWSGRVRVEVYEDNGSMVPVGAAAPVAGLWVPDEGGSVTRSDLGPGQLFQRYRYDVAGLNIPLPPGRWWLGLASADSPGGSGLSYWVSSHTQPGDPLFFGGEAHVRAPSASIFPFQPWSSMLGGAMSDMSFVIVTPTFADCNCNTVEDLQDIADLTSSDCNSNDIPDECDEDCNGSGTPDDCDISSLASPDCQANGVPDECDVFFGDEPDFDGNNIPDQCCEPVASPLPEPIVQAKNRFITLRPGNPGRRTALRVRLTSLQHPNPPNSPQYPPQDFSAFEGTYRWVGPPSVYPDASPTPTFTAARLQCQPFAMDWSTIPLLHVYGPEVIPSSVYEVVAIDEDCVLAGDLGTASAPLAISTARWGDIASPFQPPSSIKQPDSLDVTASVNKFRGVFGAPPKVLAKLQPDSINPGHVINALDIVSTVDAFAGKRYPYHGIVACPP